MVTTILLDIDGVIIQPRKKYFSDRLIKDFKIPPEEVADFVKNALIPACVGQTDIKRQLGIYIKKWNLQMSVEEVLEYWWSKERTINNSVLEIVAQFRTKTFKIYYASDQEKARADYLLNTLSLKNYVDGAFMSYEIGFRKRNKEFFEYILKTLKIENPACILYWDDDSENVEIARELGIQARLYKDFNVFKEEMLALV